ncbi:serine hydrolase domain-containing protein [Alteromonas gilva]|uniref:Serine hydrolase n=1 Tax=Alteromonas gilva TaxID=2987522 RepID=A0ABT5L4H5_9ALTE|nr:serine hydrolase domain-containing protein [Alteromonas gilva]MDC8830767.1 serine hydrolase [Alteromonas gilva]
MKNWNVALPSMTCVALVTQVSVASEVNYDELFSSLNSDKAPGCSIGVIEDGKLVHQQGYGMANLELDVPLSGNNVHRIGSISKQFTAFAVLLLAEEGKISLSDDIRKHLPKLMDYQNSITINAMLGHFAGMGDYDSVEKVVKSAADGPFRLGNEDYLTIDEFYDLVKTIPLRHAPDEKFNYSNLAYFLLSMLVEEVSGESLREYAHKRIFKPLNMNETFFSDEPTEIVKNRASGYRKNDEGDWVIDMTNLFWVGDGGLHTTVADLAKWDAYFYTPTLGKTPEVLLKQFLTPNSDFGAFMDGKYANGQVVAESEGHQVVAHGGGWLGVNAFYERYPEVKFSTIVLCNDPAQSAYDQAKKAAKAYFGQSKG